MIKLAAKTTRMTRWELSLAVLTATLAIGAGASTMLTGQREQALLDTVHYNDVFVATQTANELVRFEAQVGRYALDPSPELRDDVQLRFAILQNRLSVVQKGDIRVMIEADSKVAAAVAAFSDGLSATEDLVDNLQQKNAPSILQLLTRADAATILLVTLTNDAASLGLEREASQLNAFYLKGELLTASLIACGLGLVFMLVRRNKRVYQLAHTDPLTGLPNRLEFKRNLSALLSGKAPSGQLAVMLLDLDLFKNVNDAFGHTVGDELLLAVAQRLKMTLKDARLVARLGGDEFAVLLSAEDARRASAEAARDICAAVCQPFNLEGRSVVVSMSVGIVAGSLYTSDQQTLFRNADLALYSAKAGGRGTFRFFEPRMECELRERREMEDDLRAALRNDELEVYFQPIVGMRSFDVVSCEALARWHHPRHGFIPPSVFIPIAEEIGLITELGDWVIERACREAATWPQSVRVSINLSPRQFSGTGLIQTLQRVLDSTGLSASRLELEITESVLLRDTDQVLQILSSLKALGARIAFDDFGTGYSSLGYLQRFPIDKIKIDQSFIREITRKPESALIVESVGVLANKLGLITTAEGIETEEEANLIRAMGYVEGQGYYFAKPLTPAMCLARLEEQDSRLHAA